MSPSSTAATTGQGEDVTEDNPEGDNSHLPPPPLYDRMPPPDVVPGPLYGLLATTLDDAALAAFTDDEEVVEVSREQRMQQLAELAIARGEPPPRLWVPPQDTLLNPRGPGSAAYPSLAEPSGMGSSVPGPVNQRKRKTPPTDAEPEQPRRSPPQQRITRLDGPQLERDWRLMHLRQLAGLRAELRALQSGFRPTLPWLEVERDLRDMGENPFALTDLWDHYGQMVQDFLPDLPPVDASGDTDKGKGRAAPLDEDWTQFERQGRGGLAQPMPASDDAAPSIFRPQAPAGLGDQTLGGIAGGTYAPRSPVYHPVPPTANPMYDAGRHIEPHAGPRPDMTPTEWELWMRSQEDAQVAEAAGRSRARDEPSGPGEGSSKRRRRE